MVIGQGLQQGCQLSYFYDAATSQCLPCNNPPWKYGGCRTCTAFGQCITCPIDFELTSDKNCTECQKYGASCLGRTARNYGYYADRSYYSNSYYLYVFLLLFLCAYLIARGVCVLCRSRSKEEERSVRQMQKLEKQQVELANREHASLIQQLKRKVSLDYYMRNNISTKTDISTFLHASLRPDTDALLKLAKAQAFPHKKEPAKPQ